MRLPRELDALQELGFSAIEARVYACLLQESPATGYRISHLIGRPTPNTYKALASLAQKGAVVLDDGESRLCRAVPPAQLLLTLERRFQERRSRARAALESLKPAAGDDRVYQIHSVDQALERARDALDRTRSLALLDVFPGPFERLRDSLEAAARRARVAAKVYAPCSARGVLLIPAVDPARVRSVWPGQHLSLVRDAEEHLLALFAEDLGSLHQAVWSESTFLSCMHHNHLASELLLTRETRRAGGAGSFHRRLHLTTSGVSGFRTLVERFGTAAATPRSTSDRPRRRRAR